MIPQITNTRVPSKARSDLCGKIRGKCTTILNGWRFHSFLSPMRLTARPDLLYNVPVNRGYSIVASVFVLVAVLRVLHEDRQLSQGFDESCHVAAGMEWLDRHAYTLDPVHPPLARYAVKLPLYWAGERFPKFSGDDPRAHNYNDVGDAIFAGSGHYRRNLLLARIGILPFLCL